jgi:hypothetical protein
MSTSGIGLQSSPSPRCAAAAVTDGAGRGAPLPELVAQHHIGTPLRAVDRAPPLPRPLRLWGVVVRVAGGPHGPDCRSRSSGKPDNLYSNLPLSVSNPICGRRPASKRTKIDTIFRSLPIIRHNLIEIPSVSTLLHCCRPSRLRSPRRWPRRAVTTSTSRAIWPSPSPSNSQELFGRNAPSPLLRPLRSLARNAFHVGKYAGRHSCRPITCA